MKGKKKQLWRETKDVETCRSNSNIPSRLWLQDVTTKEDYFPFHATT